MINTRKKVLTIAILFLCALLISSSPGSSSASSLTASGGDCSTCLGNALDIAAQVYDDCMWEGGGDPGVCQGIAWVAFDRHIDEVCRAQGCFIN